jgi:hypothetical protein
MADQPIPPGRQDGPIVTAENIDDFAADAIGRDTFAGTQAQIDRLSRTPHGRAKLEDFRPRGLGGKGRVRRGD